jgi:hypothetical protein
MVELQRTRDGLLAYLRHLADYDAHDMAEDETHELADKALLSYIGDPEISEAFEAIDKWYE